RRPAPARCRAGCESEVGTRMSLLRSADQERPVPAGAPVCCRFEVLGEGNVAKARGVRPAATLGDARPFGQSEGRKIRTSRARFGGNRAPKVIGMRSLPLSRLWLGPGSAAERAPRDDPATIPLQSPGFRVDTGGADRDLPGFRRGA